MMLWAILPWLLRAGAVAFDARIPAGSRCAVVFNSGVLRKFRHGAAIDAHDVVIRINMLNRTGHESFLGSRWTHEFASFQKPLDGYACPADKFAAEAPRGVVGLSFERHSPADCGRHAVCCRDRILARHGSWVLLPEAFSLACRELVVGTHLSQCSSGFAAALLARSRCANVTVFGANDDPCFPYHYTDPPFPPDTCARALQRRKAPPGYVKYHRSPHSFNREHEVLREWRDAGDLVLAE
jgi:hypothetical protein